MTCCGHYPPGALNAARRAAQTHLLHSFPSPLRSLSPPSTAPPFPTSLRDRSDRGILRKSCHVGPCPASRPVCVASPAPSSAAPNLCARRPLAKALAQHLPPSSAVSPSYKFALILPPLKRNFYSRDPIQFPAPAPPCLSFPFAARFLQRTVYS